MALVQRDNFTGTSGIWTYVQTSGTVSVAGGELRMLLTSGNQNTCGAYLTSTFTAAAGDNMEASILMSNADGELDFFQFTKAAFSVGQGAGFQFSNTASLAGDDNVESLDNIGTGGLPTSPPGRVHRVELNFVASDQIRYYVAGALEYTTTVVPNIAAGNSIRSRFVANYYDPNELRAEYWARWTGDNRLPPTATTFAKGTITTTPTHAATIPFTWINNGSAINQDGFYLYSSVDGAAYSLAHDVNSAVATSYSYAALQGHHYQFKIVTYVDVGGTIYEAADSNVLTFDTPVDPPTNLSAVAAGETEIDLEWDSTTDGWEDGFSIERSETSGSGFTVIDTVSGGVTDFQDTTVSADTTYYYKVRSFWDVANPPTIYSDYTSEASATTSGGDDGDDGADMLIVDSSFG